MPRDGIHNLGIRDTEDLAEYLLHYLSMPLRLKLMAERPLLYSRLYPEVDAETIAFTVSAAVHQEHGTPVE